VVEVCDPSAADLDEVSRVALTLGHLDQERVPLGAGNGQVAADLDQRRS
jgi:hypothetical protein